MRTWKGISEVTGALLLVLIGIAASSLLFLYVAYNLNILDSRADSTQQKPIIVIEEVLDHDSHSITVVLRNPGNTPVIIDSCYVYDKENKLLAILKPSTSGTITIEAKKTLTITFDTPDYIPSTAYMIEVRGKEVSAKSLLK